MAEIEVRVCRVAGADPQVALPELATAGAAGADLRANLEAADRAGGLVLGPGERALVPTGLRIELPAGHEAQVRPRSGLALRHAVTVLNAPGTIDSDYRGPVGVILINLGTEPVTIAQGERIAQLVVAPVSRVRYREVAALTGSSRGAGGFGSTGRD